MHEHNNTLSLSKSYLFFNVQGFHQAALGIYEHLKEHETFQDLVTKQVRDHGCGEGGRGGGGEGGERW